MLTLTAKNINALNAMQLWDFHYTMVEHCRDTLSEYCDTYSDKELHTLVERGINRAEYYGFDQKGPVRLYIELTLLLGEDFDIAHPWAYKCLTNEDIVEPLHRAEYLYKKACEYDDL